MFSGVLQGCPASAFLFDRILDPFLEAFGEVIYQYSASKQCNPTHIGILRCCADDVGAALLSLVGLKYLAPIFGMAELLAGLMLKPVKCVIVPTSCEFSQEVVEKRRKSVENQSKIYENLAKIYWEQRKSARIGS